MTSRAFRKTLEDDCELKIYSRAFPSIKTRYLITKIYCCLKRSRPIPKFQIFLFGTIRVYREFARVRSLTSTVETRKTSRGNSSSRGFTRLRQIQSTKKETRSGRPSRQISLVPLSRVAYGQISPSPWESRYTIFTRKMR